MGRVRLHREVVISALHRDKAFVTHPHRLVKSIPSANGSRGITGGSHGGRRRGSVMMMVGWNGNGNGEWRGCRLGNGACLARTLFAKDLSAMPAMVLQNARQTLRTAASVREDIAAIEARVSARRKEREHLPNENGKLRVAFTARRYGVIRQPLRGLGGGLGRCSGRHACVASVGLLLTRETPGSQLDLLDRATE